MNFPIVEIIVGIVTVCLFYVCYDKYLKSQRDIHELALQEQSNISVSRKSDETAIYRNNLIPHEMPLVTGLQIRQGFKLRDGNIRDIWSVGMNHKTSTFQFTDENIKLSIFQLNSSIKQLNEIFKQKQVKVVGSCIPCGSIEGFITGMTCFTNGLTFYSFDGIPRFKPEVDIMIIKKSQLNFIKPLGLNLFIIEDDWSINYDKSDPNFEYKYQNSYDQGIPLINSIGNKSYSFTHQNFVSATSSLVKAIPLGHEFNSKDLLLVHKFNNQIHFWSKIFAIILFGGSIISNNSNELLIQELKPTIVLINTETAKHLLNRITSKLSIFQNLKISRSQQLLSDGIFSYNSQLSGFKHLRLMYITTYAKFDDTISSLNLTLLRSLTGSRIINERILNQLSGPLTSTNFYDYRVFSNNIVNRGTSSLSLEMKLFKKDGLDIEKKKGELCIRGFIVGRPTDQKELENAINEGERVGSEGWMPTGITGTFGRDGCLYEII